MSDDEEKPPIGKLVLSVKNAFLSRDVTTFATMDPYVMLRYGTVKFKTNPCMDGGKTPHWDDVTVLLCSESLFLGIRA